MTVAALHPGKIDGQLCQSLVKLSLFHWSWCGWTTLCTLNRSHLSWLTMWLSHLLWPAVRYELYLNHIMWHVTHQSHLLRQRWRTSHIAVTWPVRRVTSVMHLSHLVTSVTWPSCYGTCHVPVTSVVTSVTWPSRVMWHVTHQSHLFWHRWHTSHISCNSSYLPVTCHVTSPQSCICHISCDPYLLTSH